MTNQKTTKRWERTSTTNLWKLAATGGYYARVKVNKKEKWKSLKTKSSAVAKSRLADFEKAERAKANIETIKVEGHSAGDFLDHFIADNKLRSTASSTIERVHSAALALEKTWPEFRSLHVSNITPSMCKQWAQHAKETGTCFLAPRVKRVPRPMSASSFNKTLSVLRSTLELAVKAGALYSNPATEVERMPPKKKELILPTRKQLAKIIRSIEKSPARHARQSADMVSFLVYTGARIGECRAAIWADIDKNRNMMRIHGTKTRASDRWIPLFPNLKTLLNSMRARNKPETTEGKLFTTHECADALAAACAKTGVKKMSHHDLRHLFATRCIEAGVDIPTVSRWLGHADRGALVMSTYGHLRQDHSQAQAKKVTW